MAVENKLDVPGYLTRVGLLSPEDAEAQLNADGSPVSQSWMRKVLSGSSSTLALAFIANKALFPVRTPITLALTPFVAR